MWKDVEQIITEGMDVRLGSLQNVLAKSTFCTLGFEKGVGAGNIFALLQSFFLKLRKTQSNPKCRPNFVSNNHFVDGGPRDQFCCCTRVISTGAPQLLVFGLLWGSFELGQLDVAGFPSIVGFATVLCALQEVCQGPSNLTV